MWSRIGIWVCCVMALCPPASSAQDGPTAVDERLAAPDYLTSIPVTIHPSLGNVRLRLFGHRETGVGRIEVFDLRTNTVRQRIEWPADDQDPRPLSDGEPRVETPDFNFDGYRDLSVGSWAGASNKGSVVWLFDPRRAQYVYQRELSGLSNLDVDTARRQLTTYYTGGHAGMICAGDTLQWSSGRAAIVRQVRQGFDEPRRAYVKEVRERRGGRLVLVRRETDFFESGKFVIEQLDGDRIRSTVTIPRDEATEPAGCAPPAWLERLR